jgi:hypothetical protein
MGFNKYPIRGAGVISRDFITMPVTGSVVVSADQGQAEILIFGSATITAGVPGGITLTGATTIQLPCTVRTGNDTKNGDDGQWWWFDLTAITYSGQTITVSGTKADGTATTGFSLTSGAIHSMYWNGSDLVKLS